MSPTLPPPSETDPASAPKRRSWLDVAEAGSMLGLDVMVWLMRFAGRRVTRVVLAVVVFYFVLFKASARAASRDYLRRMDQPHGFWAVYRHVLRFGQVTVDRFLMLGAHDGLDVQSRGDHLIYELLEEGRGGIVLGAHLGSFEALRMICRDNDVTIHVLGDFRNSRRINAVLDRINPENSTHIIEVPEGNPAGMALQLKDLIERGEIVAMLGDRAAPHMKAAEVDFLGGRAKMPVGPYALASVLRCPIVLAFGMHFAPNRYMLVAERFADRVRLPRKTREEAMQAYAQQFADRLAHYCREAPDNWFNFYDYWQPEPTSERELLEAPA